MTTDTKKLRELLTNLSDPDGHTLDEVYSTIERIEAGNKDLLEALKALVIHMNTAFDAEGDTFGMGHNDAVDALQVAEAAIAKAEGKS